MAMVCCKYFSNDKADEDVFKNLVVNHFQNKVESYEGQNRKGGREIIDEHVWRCSRFVVQTVEWNSILIPEVANYQATLRHRELIMDCAILFALARLIVATAILLRIRFFKNEKFNKIIVGSLVKTVFLFHVTMPLIQIDWHSVDAGMQQNYSIPLVVPRILIRCICLTCVQRSLIIEGEECVNDKTVFQRGLLI